MQSHRWWIYRAPLEASVALQRLHPMTKTGVPPQRQVKACTVAELIAERSGSVFMRHTHIAYAGQAAQIGAQHGPSKVASRESSTLRITASRVPPRPMAMACTG